VKRAAVLAPAAFALLGCVEHATPQRDLRPAELGIAPVGFDVARACGAWSESTGDDPDAAASHVSFPEIDPEASCFVRVHHDATGRVHPDATPNGCGYSAEQPTIARIDATISAYEAALHGDMSATPTLACDLSRDVRDAAARANLTTLHALRRRLVGGARYPYAAVSIFGFGLRHHDRHAIARYRPGNPCETTPIEKAALDDLGVNVVRAGRGSAAIAGGVAPVLIATGGAVHSRTVEAFALGYLATCVMGVRADRVLYDPCAAHTHENIRNTGRLVVAIGGRTAYLLTDDGLQSGYLQEWTFFDAFGGSIDQRSLRDWGYLLGAFRQASEGIDAGFWYSPYRFWARGKTEASSFTCLDR
jgi:hypothetical protein